MVGVTKTELMDDLFLGEENLQNVEVGGDASWEESCLVKFSEFFLGFSMAGHEMEIINMLRNLNANQSQNGSRGQLGLSKCERELKKLECTINYNRQGSGKVVGRCRGNFLLSLK